MVLNKDKPNMLKEMAKFFRYFVLILVIITPINQYFNRTINNNYIQFIIINMFSLFIIDFYNINEIIWLILTLLHGLAHIHSPAFNKLERNDNYTPLYDYIVHGTQCLCICLYHYYPSIEQKNNNNNNHYHYYYQLSGILLLVYTITGAIIAHL